MWVLVPATLSGPWIVSITSSLSSWDSATSTTASTSREPQHASAISRQTRDLPSDIARLARSHRNDDVGSHDLPSQHHSTARAPCSRGSVRPGHRFETRPRDRLIADAANSVKRSRRFGSFFAQPLLHGLSLFCAKPCFSQACFSRRHFLPLFFFPQRASLSA